MEPTVNPQVAGRKSWTLRDKPPLVCRHVWDMILREVNRGERPDETARRIAQEKQARSGIVATP